MLSFFFALCRFLNEKQCNKNLLSNGHTDGRTRSSVSRSLEKPECELCMCNIASISLSPLTGKTRCLFLFPGLLNLFSYVLESPVMSAGLSSSDMGSGELVRSLSVNMWLSSSLSSTSLSSWHKSWRKRCLG